MRIVRSFLMVVGAAAVLAAAGAAAAVWFLSTRDLPVPERTVLVLELHGQIVEYAPPDFTRLLRRRTSGARLWRVVETLHRAKADPRVLGLLVRIHAPGMGWAQVQELRDAVLAFRQSGKPAVAFAESFGEFGPGNDAFYLAAAFDEIYLQPSGNVGLTGLLAQRYFVKGALEKLGVEPRLDEREEYKGIKGTLSERGFTPPQREALVRVLRSLSEQVAAGVAEGRGLSRADVRGLMERAPLSAKEALYAGLVDGLRYGDEVRRMMKQRLGADAEFLPLFRYGRRLEPEGEPAATVALIYGVGQVQGGRNRYDPLGGGASMGSESVVRAFRRAVEDDEVRAIIFRIDSPGGSYVASDAIRREVARAGRGRKPVIVSMGNVAGSGGYFVAAPADRIVAQPGTLTGSIGVAAGKVVIRGLWEKLGVSWDQVAANPNATFWSALHDYEPDQWKRLERLLDVVYDDFVAKVAEGRKLPEEAVRRAAKGRVWTGADARERGLVDDLGGYAAALRAAREALGLPPDSVLRLRVLPPRKSAVRLLLEELAGDWEGDAPAPAASVRSGALARLAGWARQAGLTGRPGVLEMELPSRLR